MSPRISLLFAVLLASSCTPDKSGTSDNASPKASIDSPSAGASFDLGEPVAFVGTVSDPEDDATDLTVTWSSDLDGLLQRGRLADSDGLTYLTTSMLSAGSHTIVLGVEDLEEQSTEDLISILIIDSEANPEIHILQPSDGDVGSDATKYTFMAAVFDASDPGPALMVAFWIEEEEEHIPLCEATPTIDGMASCKARMTAGTYSILATVVDSDGNLNEDRTEGFLVEPAGGGDEDGDGYTIADGDCDDANPAIHPGASEVCDEDDVDEDCDGYADSEDVDGEVIGSSNWFPDVDRDGFGDPIDPISACEAPEGYIEDNTDCCDYDAEAFPGATDWHEDDNACGEHDWNCDGVEEQRWTNPGACSFIGSCAEDPDGWTGATPHCGDASDWLVACDTEWTLGGVGYICIPITTSIYQNCR